MLDTVLSCCLFLHKVMLQQQTYQAKIGLQENYLPHLMKNVYLLNRHTEVCERRFCCIYLTPFIVPELITYVCDVMAVKKLHPPVIHLVKFV